MEKQLNKQTSIEDIMIATLQSLKEIRLKLAQQDEAIKMLTAKIETNLANYFTIAGYCNLRGLKVDIREIYDLEQRAMWFSEDSGIPVGKFNDPDLGDFNTYHLDILGEVFNSR